MMWSDVSPVLFSAGFLGSVLALMKFLNTRKSVHDTGNSDAYKAFGSVMAGAMVQARDVNEGLVAQNNALIGRVGQLGDLVLDLLAALRRCGAADTEIEPFYDRLENLRRW